MPPYMSTIFTLWADAFQSSAYNRMFNTLSGFFNRNAAVQVSISLCYSAQMVDPSLRVSLITGCYVPELLKSCSVHCMQLSCKQICFIDRTCPRTVQTECFRLEVTLCTRMHSSSGKTSKRQLQEQTRPTIKLINLKPLGSALKCHVAWHFKKVVTVTSPPWVAALVLSAIYSEY